MVLGGLIQDSEERGRDRIPVLGEIPVVGNLFGTTSNVNIRTELIVFITPRVIRNPEDARDVSEELRSRLRSLRQAEDSAAGRGRALRAAAAASSRPAAYPQPLAGAARAARAGPLRPVAGTGRLARPGARPRQALLGALLGLCVGSFVGTLVLRAAGRLARACWCGRSQLPGLRHARSPRATSSRSGAGWRRRGRCRHCGAALAAFYPLVELGAAAIGALALGLAAGACGLARGRARLVAAGPGADRPARPGSCRTR